MLKPLSLWTKVLVPVSLGAILFAQSASALPGRQVAAGSLSDPSTTTEQAVAVILDQLSASIAATPDGMLPDRDRYLADLAAAKDSLALLDADQLAALHGYIAKNPTLAGIPAQVERALDMAAPGAAAASIIPDDDIVEDIPDDIIGDGPDEDTLEDDIEECPDAPSIEVYHTLQDVEFGLEAANDLINADLTVVVLGNGTSVPNPLKIISNVAFFAAKTATYAVGRQIENQADCEDGNHATLLENLAAYQVAFAEHQMELAEHQTELARHQMQLADHQSDFGEFQYKYSERRRITMEVVELKPKMKFLLVTSESGSPTHVDDYRIMIADPNDLAINRDLDADPLFNTTMEKGLVSANIPAEVIEDLMDLRAPGPFIDITPLFTTTQVRDGQIVLSLDPHTPAVLLNKMSVYEISISHGHSEDGQDWEHTGFSVFQRNRSDNLYLGQ